MQLTVSPVEGVSYSAAARSLPFRYHVVFEKDTTISGSIKVTGCILENKENSEIFVGYAKNIFSVPGTERLVRAGTEVVLAVDAMEHEDGPSGLIPGEYVVSAKVSVQVVNPGEALHHQELRATRQLVLL